MTTTGLDLSDIPGCYRDRAQQIADGDAVRPVVSVIVEFASNGSYAVLVLGDTANISNREHVSIQLEAIDALVHAARGFNAEAAH
jgi:hypothetical protein